MNAQTIKILGRKFVAIFLLMFLAGAPSSALAVENPLFGYTHLLPTPFTLPAGQWVVGTSTAIGVTDFLEVSTDVVADFSKIYNGQAKFSFFDFPGFAVGLYLGYQNVDLNALSTLNPSLTISSWMPGAVLGMEVLPYIAVFVGGNLIYSNRDIPGSGIQTAGFLKGGQIESDISWAYHPLEDRIGNILSGGISYNSTFELVGLGVSHHWRGFHLGVHYYPNATNLKLRPIVAGGASFDLY